MAIERKKIVAEAIALLDEVGYDSFTTRKLADRLGVKQPALYWHFKNKRALIDAVNEDILAPYIAASTPGPDDDWRTFLVRYGETTRKALLSHRDGGRVHAGAPPSEDQPARTEQQLNFLKAQGFSTLIALQALVALNSYVLGSVIDQQADDEYGIGWDKATVRADVNLPAMREGLQALQTGGRDTAFTAGLQMLVDGLEKLRNA